MPKPVSNSLAVLNTTALTDKKQLAAFQHNTAEQLAIISRTENLNVKRRLFVGLALHCIKASLKHGEFMPWLKKHAPGAGQRQCNYMMKAALVFLSESRVTAPELRALPLHDATLAVKDAAGRRIDAAAEKFVGDRSWGELLTDYGVKDGGKLGGARTAGARKADTVPDEETLYLFARDEIGGALAQVETLLVTENRLQFLAKHPDEVRGVIYSLRTLTQKVESAAKDFLKK